MLHELKHSQLVSVEPHILYTEEGTHVRATHSWSKWRFYKWKE